jgi:alkylated DNA repair dioxygenase AlkB
MAGTLNHLTNAPEPIRQLAAKLTAYAGKEINYLSVVRYRDGDDYFNWHQHKEDKQPGRDMSVWIVSTGAERPFAVRPLGGKSIRLIAESGSLIILPSSFNDTHEHAVPKCKATTVRYAVNAKHIPE